MSGLYRGLNGGGDSGIEFAWRDMLFNAFFVMVILVVMLLLMVHPEAKEDSAIESPGNIIVEVFWDDSRNVDIDLWVQAPGDKPVGYSNKAGKIFNLLRDDLGHRNDPTDINYENAFSRGAPKGEYIVNVHYFGQDAHGPIEVKVFVRLADAESKGPPRLIDQTTISVNPYQEMTIVRFELDDDGKLVPDSKNRIPKLLRNAQRRLEWQDWRYRWLDGTSPSPSDG